MRVLTHNFLQSTVKGTHSGYPLAIEASSVVVENTPFDREMVLKMLPRLNYDAIVAANKQLSAKTEGTPTELPEKLPSDINDELLQALHHVLFDIHLVEGFLICPGTGRKFPVKDSIPNMILHSDEI